MLFDPSPSRKCSQHELTRISLYLETKCSTTPHEFAAILREDGSAEVKIKQAQQLVSCCSTHMCETCCCLKLNRPGSAQTPQSNLSHSSAQSNLVVLSSLDSSGQPTLTVRTCEHSPQNNGSDLGYRSSTTVFSSLHRHFR